ncbi:uncharacterized protein PV07_10541 [Cladophialophora immunda]|uniref:Protein kinase domain-containing protein n=1 Tax=Cladophialophora immunda TaxID=569365 RepID=A0A0D2C0K2_9EURO|nr:uncharacterized protein PV07_10541 [Cladophialophora immunda]KIW24853.1 hypothetical protein PV07_10541 [Cladophialophora immunda]
MDDPNIFLTLTPCDKWGLTADSFRLPHNVARYVQPCPISRETTPGDSVHDETPVNELEYFHRIQLRFDQETKVKGRVTFGSDPELCDVLLDSRRPRFYITFDSKQRPVIWDDSNNGFTVSYDGQAKDERRNHFKWIFFTGYKTIRVTIPLRKERQLAFDVHLPPHYKTHREEYKNNVERFMADAPQDYDVAFDNLALRSEGPSFAPSESLSPTKRPIYLKGRELGKGIFGRVWKVQDASTGFEYAGKKFFHSTGWEREIEIMKKLRHDHVVRFFDFKRDPGPLLVMEYVPLGNLQQQNTDSPIAVEEWSVLLYQCLTALDYLHHRNIAHRDLKPDNILVCSRTPFWVKVGDFGLGKEDEDEDLKTRCGNDRYSAPEAYSNRPYTNAVDIWQLGVIVMEGLYGLPRDTRRKNVKQPNEIQRQALGWCQLIIEAAEDWESDSMIDFLRGCMIIWEPAKRLPADECVQKGLEAGLFTGVFSQTGNVTPRLQPDGGTGDVNIKEASTVMGPLWQNVRTSPRNEERTLRLRGTPSPPLHECEQVPQSHGGISLNDDESTSLVTPERYDNRFAKRRRTTDDFEPNLQFPGSVQQLGWPQLPQVAANRGEKGSMGREGYTARPAVSDEDPDQDDEITEIPPVQPPLERRGKFIVQSTEEHQALLRIIDGQVNFTMDTSSIAPWIDIHTARELCSIANVGAKFQPLFSFGEARQAQVPVIRPEPQQQMIQNGAGLPAFTPLIFNGNTVLVRNADSWINATQILRAAGFNRPPFSWQDQNFAYERVGPLGVFVNVDIAIRFCELYNLPELGMILRGEFQGEHQDLVFTRRQRQKDKDKFHLVSCAKDTVAVRRSDLKVNLAHIFKASPAHRSHRDAALRFKKRNPFSVEVVRGDSKTQGSYVDISLATNLSQLLGLPLIAKALVQLIGENLLPQREGPSTAAQPKGILAQPGPAKDINNGDNSGPDMTISEIDRLLNVSQPSFRFMMPSRHSQSSRLGMDHPQNNGGVQKPGEWMSQISLSSLIIPSDLSCFKQDEPENFPNQEQDQEEREACPDQPGVAAPYPQPGPGVPGPSPTSATSQTPQRFVFVPNEQPKRPRRKPEEIERLYKCGWNGCEKAYGNLGHLNQHVSKHSHGPKRKGRGDG